MAIACDESDAKSRLIDDVARGGDPRPPVVYQINAPDDELSGQLTVRQSDGEVVVDLETEFRGESSHVRWSGIDDESHFCDFTSNPDGDCDDHANRSGTTLGLEDRILEDAKVDDRPSRNILGTSARCYEITLVGQTETAIWEECYSEESQLLYADGFGAKAIITILEITLNDHRWERNFPIAEVWRLEAASQ